MATAYPGALDTSGSQQRTDIASTDDLDASGKEHDVMHVNHAGALIALETKLGLTDSNAVDGAILVGSAASTTSWTTSPSINITGNASGTAATVTGAAQTNITSVGTLSALAVTGAVTAGSVVAPLAINNQTAHYTLVLTDAGKIVEMNDGSALNLTIPPTGTGGGEVNFPIGTQIIIVQQGAGAVTIVEGTGVTTRSLDDAAIINGQYVSVALIQRATKEWYIFGNLTS